MVDSMPTGQAPPSRIRSNAPAGFSPRSARTCSAVVGLRCPKRFALGAASAPPKACSSARAHGCAGQRRPTVSCPPVTTSSARGLRLSTSVSGPGQKAAASARAESGTSRAQSSIALASATCTITGWSAGRPFAAKIARTAASFAASAASP